MRKTSFIATALVAGLMSSTTLQAQPPYAGAADMAANNPTRGAMQAPRLPRMSPSRTPAVHQFPSPGELARLVPPEPMTEARIQQQFAAQREQLLDMIERDRDAATRYAQDFAKYQKQQADALKDLMSRAEKRREAMLQHLDKREQQVLERFRQYQQAKQSAAEPTSQDSAAQ
jgi:hypothetical protein